MDRELQQAPTDQEVLCDLTQQLIHDNQELLNDLQAERRKQEEDMEDTIDLFVAVLLENKSYYIRLAKAKLKEIREKLL